MVTDRHALAPPSPDEALQDQHLEIMRDRMLTRLDGSRIDPTERMIAMRHPVGSQVWDATSGVMVTVQHPGWYVKKRRESVKRQRAVLDGDAAQLKSDIARAEREASEFEKRIKDARAALDATADPTSDGEAAHRATLRANVADLESRRDAVLASRGHAKRLLADIPARRKAIKATGPVEPIYWMSESDIARHEQADLIARRPATKPNSPLVRYVALPDEPEDDSIVVGVTP